MEAAKNNNPNINHSNNVINTNNNYSEMNQGREEKIVIDELIIYEL